VSKCASSQMTETICFPMVSIQWPLCLDVSSVRNCEQEYEESHALEREQV
jgi:hypothetical protein